MDFIDDVLGFVVVVLFLFGLVFAVVWAFGEGTSLTEKECISDCEQSNGGFARFLKPYYGDYQCICNIDGEVKNIW